jgi:hypothetical protein
MLDDMTDYNIGFRDQILQSDFVLLSTLILLSGRQLSWNVIIKEVYVLSDEFLKRAPTAILASRACHGTPYHDSNPKFTTLNSCTHSGTKGPCRVNIGSSAKVSK